MINRYNQPAELDLSWKPVELPWELMSQKLQESQKIKDTFDVLSSKMPSYIQDQYIDDSPHAIKYQNYLQQLSDDITTQFETSDYKTAMSHLNRGLLEVTKQWQPGGLAYALESRVQQWDAVKERYQKQYEKAPEYMTNLALLRSSGLSPITDNPDYTVGGSTRFRGITDAQMGQYLDINDEIIKWLKETNPNIEVTYDGPGRMPRFRDIHTKKEITGDRIQDILANLFQTPAVKQQLEYEVANEMLDPESLVLFNQSVISENLNANYLRLEQALNSSDTADDAKMIEQLKKQGYGITDGATLLTPEILAEVKRRNEQLVQDALNPNPEKLPVVAQTKVLNRYLGAAVANFAYVENQIRAYRFSDQITINTGDNNPFNQGLWSMPSLNATAEARDNYKAQVETLNTEIRNLESLSETASLQDAQLARLTELKRTRSGMLKNGWASLSDENRLAFVKEHTDNLLNNVPRSQRDTYRQQFNQIINDQIQGGASFDEALNQAVRTVYSRLERENMVPAKVNATSIGSVSIFSKGPISLSSLTSSIPSSFMTNVGEYVQNNVQNLQSPDYTVYDFDKNSMHSQAARALDVFANRGVLDAGGILTTPNELYPSGYNTPTLTRNSDGIVGVKYEAQPGKDGKSGQGSSVFQLMPSSLPALDNMRHNIVATNGEYLSRIQSVPEKQLAGLSTYLYASAFSEDSHSTLENQLNTTISSLSPGQSRSIELSAIIHDPRNVGGGLASIPFVGTLGRNSDGQYYFRPGATENGELYLSSYYTHNAIRYTAQDLAENNPIVIGNTVKSVKSFFGNTVNIHSYIDNKR